MLQITQRLETVEASDDDDEGDEVVVNPNEPTTSSGKRSGSHPPPFKKYRSSASGSPAQYLSDTLKMYMNRSDAEAQEVIAEVNKHPICTENTSFTLHGNSMILHNNDI